MADVVFLTGVTDLLEFSCRLVRKKHREGARVAVFGPPELLRALDGKLWADDDTGFLPHRLLPAGARLPDDARRTPHWLLEAVTPGLDCDTAINLGLDDVEGLLEFARVAEVIADGDGPRQAGRLRWKRYQSAGRLPTARAIGHSADPVDPV